MRVLLAAFLLILFFPNAVEAAPVKTVDRVFFGGAAYCRLNQWGKTCGLKMNWNRQSGDVVLSNGSNIRIVFAINSRRCSINGNSILLSLPIQAHGDDVLIPVVELETTIHPVLFPVRYGPSKKVLTICIDPGHGGKDTGKIQRSNYEKTFTLLLAQEVATRLKTFNLNVVMTRKKDETLELSDRTEFASRKKADLFVSLHYNAASPNISGVEVYCLAPAGLASSNEGGGRSGRHACPGNNQNSQNILLAQKVQRMILHGTGLEDRGLKRSRFQVLRDARMPAILIEGGFMTNPGDAKKIYDPKFRARMAQCIVDGIIAYKRTVERR